MNTVFDIFNKRQPAIQIQQYQQPQYNNNFLSQLKQFAGGLTGNPEQLVRNLMSSGRMSQQQFDMFGQQASQIQKMFNLK